MNLLSTSIPNLLPQRRAPGLHISTIIHSYCVYNNHYDPNPLDMNIAQLGLSLEHAIAQRFMQHSQLHSPLGPPWTGLFILPSDLGRQTQSHDYDGIYLDDPTIGRVWLTGDLIFLPFTHPLGWVPTEVKLSKMNSRTNPPDAKKFIKFWIQNAAYGYAYSTLYHVPVTRGRMIVCHINGDYSWLPQLWNDTDEIPDKNKSTSTIALTENDETLTVESDSPVPVCTWEREYTRDELWMNWQLLVDHWVEHGDVTDDK